MTKFFTYLIFIGLLIYVLLNGVTCVTIKKEFYSSSNSGDTPVVVTNPKLAKASEPVQPQEITTETIAKLTSQGENAKKICKDLQGQSELYISHDQKIPEERIRCTFKLSGSGVVTCEQRELAEQTCSVQLSNKCSQLGGTYIQSEKSSVCSFGKAGECTSDQLQYDNCRLQNVYVQNLTYTVPEAYTVSISKTQATENPFMITFLRKDISKCGKLEIFKMDYFTKREAVAPAGTDESKLCNYIPRKTQKITLGNETFDVWFYADIADANVLGELENILTTIQIKK